MPEPDAITLIPAMFHRNVCEHGDETALVAHRGGAFQPVTWNALHRDVIGLAAAFRRRGLQPGDRIVQIAPNCYEWIVVDLASMFAQTVHVPVHVTLSGEQMAYQITNSGARAVIVSGDDELDKLTREHPGQDDLLEAFRTAGRLWSNVPGKSVATGTLVTLIDETTDAEAAQVEPEALTHIAADDLITIMYTSGTTGEPRGVMLSHGNLASNAIATAEAFEQTPDELRLCFLPLSHIYARTCDMYTWLWRGSRLALAQSRDTILADCAELRPTLINGVPYFYEKLCHSLREAGKQSEAGALRSVLGGRVRFCFSGGAALPEHVENFFQSQDLPLLQGYGLSESSPVITASTMDAHKIGSVGKTIDGVEVQIADDGEILTRGPHVMLGYWQNEAATREAIRDGWLHTGDLGALDNDGFLTITGRKKEIIVTASGKNVVPSYLEGLLSASPLVHQAMVVGEGRKFLAALLVPEAERLRSEIRDRRIRVLTRRGALRHPRVRAIYREEIDRLLASVSKHEQIGQFILLDRGFTQEAGEVTPKASLRREVIAQHFAGKIEKMYAQQK